MTSFSHINYLFLRKTKRYGRTTEHCTDIICVREEIHRGVFNIQVIPIWQKLESTQHGVEAKVEIVISKKVMGTNPYTSDEKGAIGTSYTFLYTEMLHSHILNEWLFKCSGQLFSKVKNRGVRLVVRKNA